VDLLVQLHVVPRYKRVRLTMFRITPCPRSATEMAVTGDGGKATKTAHVAFRNSHRLRNCETLPVPHKTGSRFVRTRPRNNNRFGSVLRWCSAVRLLWRIGLKPSAAVLAQPVRKAAAMAVAIAAVNHAAEAAGTAVANRVETAAATTATIAELEFSSLKKARWQNHSAGPFFLTESFYQVGIFYRDTNGLREFQAHVVFRSLAGHVPDRCERGYVQFGKTHRNIRPQRDRLH
jgi:hypothetical protein